MDLDNRSITLHAAQAQLKRIEQEYEVTNRQSEKYIKECEAEQVRADSQLAQLRQIESQLDKIDYDEDDLMRGFADFLVEARSKFESLSVSFA